MFSPDDTIVAIATPPGRGGIGVVRVSGPGAGAIAEALTGRRGFEPRHATLATVTDSRHEAIDRAIVTLFPAPHSYTGEDVVEVSAHGSPIVLEAIVAAAQSAGARLANPGEFTLRAYLHGRVDLVQAEAVAELVDAVTPLQARLAFDQLEGTLTSRLERMDQTLLDLIARLEASLDFPDEGYHFITPAETAAALEAILASLGGLLRDAARGRMIREGLTVAILGRPNVGKSSLFNSLVGAARAIVTDVPGTTRDLVSERVDLEGVPVTLVDTAGLRDAAENAIEAEGVARARKARDVADAVIVVLDRSQPLTRDDRAILDETIARRRVVVANKSDLPEVWSAPEQDAHEVSAATGAGIAGLRGAIVRAAGGDILRDRAPIANLRHAALLEDARAAVSRARASAAASIPEEFVLADLHEARGYFDEISGARPRDEVLTAIFDRFCIGK
ncbi:MAG TPA: tRNA uridine-5-carboxymethylaminomethyl(34) synthesis GTPase MnmE [Vicinamibacterales bacterium]|jgi:tRNA modification GTPase|nr:tRNA uridine-5-carboxymethylaminomethyl(34) synthesis GTPase MnmE [Vicinamibacterales bacterium]